MRTILHLLVFSAIFLFGTSLSAQNKKPVNTKLQQPKKVEAKSTDTKVQQTKKPDVKITDPFRKGTWSFSNYENISYSNFKRTPGTSFKDRTFNFMVDPSYYFLNHFAIGLDARAGSQYHNGPLISLDSWQADLTLTYGRKITDKLNLFARIAAGPGHSKSTMDISTLQNSPKTLKADYLDIKASIGAPFSITQDGLEYITPYFYYDHYHTKTPSQEFTTAGISFGIRPQTFINCGNKPASGYGDVSKTAYLKGQNFLEFNSMLTYSHTKQVQEMRADIIYSNWNFGLGYNYYFMDNFAGGLNLSWSSNATTTPGASHDKFTKWMIQPVLIAQVPVNNPAHNLFLEAAYGFGGDNQSGLKHNLSDLFIKAGYNIFLSQNLALTPRIGFERDTRETTAGSSRGFRTDHAGLSTEIGLRTWLNLGHKR